MKADGTACFRFGRLGLRLRLVLLGALAFAPFGGVSARAASATPRGTTSVVTHRATPTGGLDVNFRGDAVRLNVTSPALFAPSFGFAPFRVSTESTETRDLAWRVNFQTSYFSNLGNTAESMETALPVPARRVAERWIFLPVGDDGLDTSAGYHYGNITGHISGRGIDDAMFSLNAAPSGSHSGPHVVLPMAPIAASATVEPAVRQWLNRTLKGNLNLAAFDPERSIGDWRVWSPFARIVMRQSEFVANPETRASLRAWVALGGWLYLAPDAPAAASTESLGAGVIVTLAQSIADPGAMSHDFFPGGLTPPTLAQPQRDTLGLAASQLALSIAKARSGGDWLLFFFIAFAVVIAPVNLFVFAPARRRERLFFTVPLISISAVVILFGVILLQDGVGGSGARRALVVLLPGENQAAVFQEQVTRTGLLFNPSFPLADDALCAQVAVEASSPGNNRKFVREAGQASGDWFRSRSRQAQHLRRITPTRARVELVGSAPDGAPIVQSSVSTTLREFAYRDAQGGTWVAKEIAPGTRVTLAKVTSMAGARDSFVGGSRVFSEVVHRSYTDDGLWRPGCFIALASDNELAPLPTLASIKWQTSEVMFAGVVEGKALR